VKNKIGVFPGSFDPITSGHRHIIIKASKLVDVLIVGIGDNTSKKSLYSLEQREKWVKNTFKSYDNILVKKYSGLTINFAEKENAEFIFRGLRSSIDFEYEKQIAETNSVINKDIETIFLLSDKKYGMISSSIVKEIIKNNGDISDFVPKEIKIS
jgi:pantetheine-phosphate adenylyltransferase